MEDLGYFGGSESAVICIKKSQKIIAIINMAPKIQFLMEVI